MITAINQYQEDLPVKTKNGSTSLDFRKNVSISIAETAYYDSLIAEYFNKISNTTFPRKKIIYGNLIEKLKYGENPINKVQFIQEKKK